MTVENLADGGGPPTDDLAAIRYGIVLGLTAALVVFVIAAPSADWSRAVGLAIEGVALVVAIATGRNREEERLRKAAGVGAVMAFAVVGIAIGIIPSSLATAVYALATAAVPVVLIRGLLRLLSERGVTVQAVAGALAIYLSVGLVFAWIISFVAYVNSTPYFAQHTSGTVGDRVYFSFTVLTTTGFGDFTAASPVGHALAVIEMLIGQLYLVTVIGMMIGHFAGRQRTA